MYLFVYGTLKRGEPRHGYLAGQRFVGISRTRPLYRLYDLGDYPGLVERAGGVSIEGELWEVDGECLARLDRVEGCDVGLYRRGWAELVPPHHKLRAVAYFYQQSVEGRDDCGTEW